MCDCAVLTLIRTTARPICTPSNCYILTYGLWHKLTNLAGTIRDVTCLCAQKEQKVWGFFSSFSQQSQLTETASEQCATLHLLSCALRPDNSPK